MYGHLSAGATGWVRRAWVAVLLLGTMAALPASAEWFQAGQNKMGTRVFVRLWDEDAAKARTLLDASMAEFDRIEASMSTYRIDSQISRVNNGAAERWIPVDREFFRLLEVSLTLSERTGGAFDISYAAIGRFYNFKTAVRPSDMQVEAALPSVDYRHIRLDPQISAVHFSDAHARIDLGGIAKGYAVESVIGLLREAGIQNAMATAGGDTRVLGDRIDGAWIVGIRDPDDEMRLVTRFELADEAISTSGDYEQFFIEDGHRYHHILNPSTGDSAGQLRSVTVIGPDATLTDGLSTGVFVLGREAGIALIESMPDYSVIVVDADRRIWHSRDLDRLISSRD